MSDPEGIGSQAGGLADLGAPEFPSAKLNAPGDFSKKQVLGSATKSGSYLRMGIEGKKIR